MLAQILPVSPFCEGLCVSGVCIHLHKRWYIDVHCSLFGSFDSTTGTAGSLMQPNVRLRRCTCVHCIGYGASAVYSSSLMSCPFCAWGAAECHGSGKQSPPTKLDVTTQLAHQGGWSGRLVDLFLTETAAQVLCWVSCCTVCVPVPCVLECDT